MHIGQATPNLRDCDECDESVAASHFCDDCAMSLCPDCHAHHKKAKRTKAHETRPLGNTDTGLFIDPRIPECPFKDLQAPGQTEKDGDGVLEMTTSMQMLAASMPMPENADANAVDQTSPAEQTEGCSPFEASSLYATSFSGKSYATKDGHTDTSPSQGSERSGKSSPRSGAGQGSMTTVYRSGGNWTGGNCSIPHSLGASDAGHLPRAVEKAKPLPRENGLQQSDSRSNGNIGSKAKQPPDIKMVRKCLLLWKTKLVRMPVPNYLLAQGNGTDNHSGEQPGWLGVEFMNRPDGHLIITKIAPGGPADDNQGILVGDVLQAINDTVVRKLSPDEMRKLIKGHAGQEIVLTLGAEFTPHKAYTEEHPLASGDKVRVQRVTAVADKDKLQKLQKMELSGSDLLSPSLKIADMRSRFGRTDSGQFQQILSPNTRDLSSPDMPAIQIDTAMGTDDENSSMHDADYGSDEQYTDVTDGSVSPRDSSASSRAKARVGATTAF